MNSSRITCARRWRRELRTRRCAGRINTHYAARVLAHINAKAPPIDIGPLLPFSDPGIVSDRGKGSLPILNPDRSVGPSRSISLTAPFQITGHDQQNLFSSSCEEPLHLVMHDLCSGRNKELDHRPVCFRCRADSENFYSPPHRVADTDGCVYDGADFKQRQSSALEKTLELHALDKAICQRRWNGPSAYGAIMARIGEDELQHAGR
jgi:hypothetical protein